MANSLNDILLDLDDFLLERYVKPVEIDFGNLQFQKVREFRKEDSLDDIVKAKIETFQDKLFSMIKSKNLDEVEVYKNANISRQVFSNIRSDENYHPKKNTIFALAISMRLSIDETSELLKKAGYAFSSGSKADLIIQYCMYRNYYDINLVNELLNKYGFEVL